MSSSRISLALHYAMLDARKKCVPGYEDSSGGHIVFKTSAKTRVRGPGSCAFDGYGLREWDAGEFSNIPFDREAWVTSVVGELKKNLEMDAKMGDRLLRSLVGHLFDQAKAHCDEHHEDIRVKFMPAKVDET